MLDNFITILDDFVVCDHLDRIKIFESEIDARVYVAEYYEDWPQSAVLCVQLSESQIDLANLVCLYLNEFRAADLILKLDEIEEIDLSNAIGCINRIFEDQSSDCALISLDNFFAKYDICEAGDLYRTWQKQQEWAYAPFGIGSEYGE